MMSYENKDEILKFNLVFLKTKFSKTQVSQKIRFNHGGQSAFPS